MFQLHRVHCEKQVYDLENDNERFRFTSLLYRVAENAKENPWSLADSTYVRGYETFARSKGTFFTTHEGTDGEIETDSSMDGDQERLSRELAKHKYKYVFIDENDKDAFIPLIKVCSEQYW